MLLKFAELQGIVGGLYARVQQLDEEMKPDVQLAISRAIYDHYKPESMEDRLRNGRGSGSLHRRQGRLHRRNVRPPPHPSGSKNPFALRRQANGIVKTIAKHKLPLRLSEIMADARARYKGSTAEKKFSNAAYAESVRGFFRERLEFYLKEAHEPRYAYDVVNAVLAVDSDDVVDAVARAEAVSSVRDPANFTFVYFEAISWAFKRMKNILRQATEKKLRIADRVDPARLQKESEKELFAQIQVADVVKKLTAEHDYQEALREIATLRPVIDKFFDDVMVMVDEDNLRANRLALLQTVVKEFSTIADFSEIVTEGKS